MQTVILAGGLGTRLRPLTYEIPKPMVPVLGRPFLEHQIGMMRRWGCDRFLLLVGYLGEQVRDHFGNGDAFGVTIRYSFEPEPLGTGGALLRAMDQLEEAFILLYGDSYLPMDYGEMEREFLERGKLALMAVYDERDPTGVPFNVALDPQGNVVLYSKESGDPRLRYVEAGALALRREALGLLPQRKKVSLEKELFPLLVERREMAALFTPQRFYDIGTPEGLERAGEILKKGK